MRMKTLLAAALIFATGASAGTPPGLLGSKVEFQVYSPDLVKADLLGSGTATVAGPVEFPHIGQAPFLKQGSIIDASVNLTNKTLTIRYPASAEGDTFTVATFNGYVLRVLSGAAPAITSVKVLAGTNVSGVNNTRITVSAKKLELNIDGLSLPASTPGVIELGLAF